MSADANVIDDLLRPEVIADPHPVFARLRELGSIWWSEPHHAWLVTRYNDISEAYRNRALSSDRIRPLLAVRRAEQSPSATRVQELLSQWMVVSDPPEHTRLRRLVAGAFKQQRISAMTQRIQDLVDDLLDDFIAEGHSDLIQHLAYPLPAIVIAEMLGVSPEDRDQFRHWSDELALVAFGASGDERYERSLNGLEEMISFFRELIELRRRKPGNDMISAMMAGDGSGDELTENELLAMCSLLLFAGHETTTNSIANGIVSLLQFPDQLALLREHPEIISTAVEELLRFDGPIKVLTRWVKADTELAGRKIRAGERVYLVVASANRDGEKFANPDVLDLRRSPNPHLAFGKGVHACLGAQLARLETRIAVNSIVQRLPGLRLAGEPVYKASLAARALEGLQVTHEAAFATR